MTTFKFKNQVWNTEDIKRNILAWFDAADNTLSRKEYEQAFEWYHEAHEFAVDLYLKYHEQVTLPQVVGVIAALSPANNWEQNKLDTISVVTAYVNGAIESPITCTYPLQTAKAWNILNQPSNNPRELLGQPNKPESAPKTKAFFDCILKPQTNEFICVDRHAISIGLNWLDASQNLSCSYKVYKNFASAYTEAARERNVSPAELQAVTWCTYKKVVGR